MTNSYASEGRSRPCSDSQAAMRSGSRDSDLNMTAVRMAGGNAAHARMAAMRWPTRPPLALLAPKLALPKPPLSISDITSVVAALSTLRPSSLALGESSSSA
eukprot:CAMPEP_0119184532 /NCGR_PEP_ID=MMETSP1315-20130426/66692_1 /TAXON_ID=676789 /ORGANISM="Prasinoderma singularis, Strain RCC927" /LENGTH=101 /DNA_ID=CAMNT_0007178945 /DNA_START=99 /DNA_END=404 /DNA_ORIENTATION=-